MPPVTHPDLGSKQIDARTRIRNSERSSRWFSAVFWLILLGGLASAYWFYAKVYVPGEQAKVHFVQTQAYARQLRDLVGELGEWSTQASFDSVRAELVKFDEREDADLAVRRQLWGQFAAAYEPRAERMRKFEQLKGEVEDFAVTADKASFLEMQERVRRAGSEFEKSLVRELKELWAPKSEEIVSRLGLFGASGTGTLEVRSIPSGAMLYLNDREVGVTPLQGSGIRVGNLKLSLKHPQYHDLVLPIEIEEFGVLRLNSLEMKPKEGGIEITVIGAAANDSVEVELLCPNDDGETYVFANTYPGTYVAVPKLIIGGYNVTVYVNGRPRQTTQVEVIEGRVSKWTARL